MMTFCEVPLNRFNLGSSNISIQKRIDTLKMIRYLRIPARMLPSATNDDAQR